MENNEMTEREMMEFAAKAEWLSVKIGVDWHNLGNVYVNDYTWNPPTDDGDALRLAAALSMRVDFCNKTGCAARYGADCENVIYVLFDANRDLHKASRMAITIAAAEI